MTPTPRVAGREFPVIPGTADRACRYADEIGGASVNYLMFSGYVCPAHFWARAAAVASTELRGEPADPEFYRAKLHTAQFYYDHILPRTRSCAASFEAGSSSVMGLPEAYFQF